MPSQEAFSQIEETQNRLAMEAVLAQPGRDDGLIPAYSLLGELRERCAAEPALLAAADLLLPEFERCLDTAQPFTAELVARLRGFVEWMPKAVAALRMGKPAPAYAPAAIAAAPAPAAAAAPAEAVDVVLEFDLAEKRELLEEFHGEASEHLLQIEAALLELERHPADPEALNAIFRSFHTIKGNAGFLGLAPMNRLAHEVESLLDLARNRKLALTAAIVTEILRSRDALQALNHQVGEALKDGKMPARVIPVAHLIGAVRTLAAGQAPAGAAAPAPASGPEAAAAVPAARAAGNTVRVNTEKLDSLMDVVGELVIVQSQLLETAQRMEAEGPLQRDVAQLSRLTKDLQRTAMALRMIPIKPAFQKMERLARDLARETGKQLRFSTAGEETELDRIVVEEIGDPLVHMVRNAVDHGLEAPAERAAAGKGEAGEVWLRAYHKGGNVIVELQDDGRGIDPEKVLAKARRQGLVPAGAALGREEIFNLIFLPGFSTAEKVTAISGRGVGMDVVKRSIEKLRGQIEVTSEVGRGSTFRIKLPLTLAIIDGLVVRVGEDRFILPSNAVQMALKPARGAISRVQGAGEVLDWHGRLLPLHRLHRRFGIPARSEDPCEGIVVILESSDRICALLVDEMVAKQEVVIKSLGAYMQGLSGVSGGAILGDGAIALILDPASLLEAA
ncbi:MAG TPA: chemotaxis protein CheA [Opitutaceae bacterium]|nr:chemotaxis protein CheA [Opitutaceae bacterium]